MRAEGNINPADVSKFIANELTLRAWSDPKICSDFERDPQETIRAICEELNIAPELAEGLDVSIEKSPVGDIPFRGNEYLMGIGIYTWDGSCGYIPSFTGGCTCTDTSTGGCSCMYTLFGTPCAC